MLFFQWVIAGALVPISLILAMSWWLAFRSRGAPSLRPDPERWPRLLVIVPAHDEESLIFETVKRLLALDYPPELFSVYVVADNCGDRTAELARAAGAFCLIRDEPERRGKGYALDFALKKLAGLETEAVVFLDADSFPRQDYLRAMARHLAAGRKVIQGAYEAVSLDDTWFARLTAMSFTLRNRWVYPALDRLAWPVPLRGSGMCFDAEVLAGVGWKDHGLTEDLEMTLRLIDRGLEIAFAPEAVCGQYMPARPAEAIAQRQRWSVGGSRFRRSLLTRQIPEALKAGRWGLAAACAYLALPPLSAIWGALLILTPFTWFLGGGFMLWSGILFVLYSFYFLLGAARPVWRSIPALVMIPVYACWRIAISIKSSRKSSSAETWIRTERPGASRPSEGPLRIVILGIRGVPANYGGFETCVEEVGERLAAKGHQVTVYCRANRYPERPRTYKGMNCRYLPCLPHRALETLSHTALSVGVAFFRPADVFVAFNVANAAVLWPLRLRSIPLVINTDGLEWKRAKWRPAIQRFFKCSERWASRVATRLISDSRALAAYYQETYGVDSTTIAYGAAIGHSTRPELLDGLGLEPGAYFLQVTRFEPENNPLLTVRAYLTLETTKKLVLVGGGAYPGPYQQELYSLAGDRIIMPGLIYDQDILRELWANCHAYVHGNEVGGTNPALLQAMAHGCFVLARDVPFNREVLDDCGLYFKSDPQALAEVMRWSLDNEDKLAEKRRAAQKMIAANYDWDQVADDYERLCRRQIAECRRKFFSGS